MRLIATKVDKSQADAAVEAIHEYVDAEPDQSKRTKAQLDAGQVLLDTGKGDQAAKEFQNILAVDPSNWDANLGVGLALFQSGDKSKYQEAALYLRRCVDHILNRLCLRN